MWIVGECDNFREGKFKNCIIFVLIIIICGSQCSLLRRLPLFLICKHVCNFDTIPTYFHNLKKKKKSFMLCFSGRLTNKRQVKFVNQNRIA